MSNELQNKMNIECVIGMIDDYHFTEFYELVQYLADDDENNFLDLLQWCVKNCTFVDSLLQSRRRWIADL